MHLFCLTSCTQHGYHSLHPRDVNNSRQAGFGRILPRLPKGSFRAAASWTRQNPGLSPSKAALHPLLSTHGWAFAFFHAKTQEERKARIERINEQLRDFYGPLLACVTATKSAYDAMVRQHSTDGTMEKFQELCMVDPGGPQAVAYKMWMEKVLQPLNEKAASIIAEHIDLLDAQHVVPELLQLVAHVSAMRVILHRWQNGEPGTYYGSVISYPDKLREYVIREFARIKYKQSRLLGFKPPFGSQKMTSKL